MAALPRRKVPLGPFHRALGERIKKARKRRGWSQERLGEKAEASQEQVSNYERGIDPVPVYTLWRISEALGTAICRLTG